MTTTQRISTSAVLVLSLAASAAPGAFARQYDQGAASAASPAPAAYSPQDKSLLPPPAASASSLATAAKASTPPRIVHVTAASGGFDWGDAGIGAAGGFALSMIGLGGVLVVSGRRPRRSDPAPTS